MKLDAQNELVSGLACRVLVYDFAFRVPRPLVVLNFITGHVKSEFTFIPNAVLA